MPAIKNRTACAYHRHNNLFGEFFDLHGHEINIPRWGCDGASITERNSILALYYLTDLTAMLMLPANTKIYLAVAPVNMRKSFDGLCAIVVDTLQQNPLERPLFLFRGKSGNRKKSLFWDRKGLLIYYKRLEKATTNGPGSMAMRWK